MESLAIETQQLTRRFGEITAVQNLTLEVPRGIIFGFLGPNGAGKTTTIRLLLGLLESDAGSAKVLGYDIQHQADEIRARSGALLEFNGIYERLTALDNLEFYGRIWHMLAAERRQRIEALLTHFKLWDRRLEPAGTWSRGMKQKLAIARALLHHPQLVFLDEPTAGLDPVAAAALRDDLSSLAKQEGVTVFLNTHNLDEAEKLCDRVGVIREGRLIAQGSLEQLRAQSGGPRLEVSGSGFTPELVEKVRQAPEVSDVLVQDERLTILYNQAVPDAPMVALLVNAGAQIEEVHKGKASLEEVFLTLMKEESQEQA